MEFPACRLFFTAASALLLAAGLTGCGGKEAATASTEEAPEVTATSGSTDTSPLACISDIRRNRSASAADVTAR